MRSWRPKPLRIFSSAPYHHHAERKRNFDIRKHVSEPSPNAAKVAARYKHKPSRSVKEVKEPSPIGLPGARDAVIEQENRPRDFIRKIFFGAHKDENIAAFEQRHETILGILRGHGEYAGSEAARSKTKRAPTSTNQVLSRALTHKTKISSPQQTSPQQDDSVQLRRRRSFLGQAALLRGPRGILATPRERSNGRLDKRKQRPSQQTNITQDASSDTQALRSSLAPPAFRRLNLLSRDSTKSPRRILDTSRERSIGRSNKRKQRSSQQTKITQDASVGTQASQPSLASYGFRRLYLWSHDLTRSTVSSPGRPSKGKQQSPQQTKIIQDASVDTQAPEPSLAPRAFRRLNLWSRASAKSTKSSLGPLANECVGEEKIPHVAGKEHVTAHKRPHPKPAKGTKLESTTLVADEGSSRSNERKDDSAENAFLVYKDHQGDRQRLRLSPQDARGIAGRSQSVSVTADEISDKSKSRKLLKPNVSLFEELFPEEAAKHSSSGKGFVRKRHDIPKLSLPVVDEDDSFGDEYVRVPTSSTDQDKTLLQDAHRSWDPSFLVLQVASPSLIDSDFRRIAPKGQHISEWTGPGDYFKVIPYRDPITLKQLYRYYLIFPNPTYAYAYKHHVISLHNLARTHTPTSILSPMAPPKGMLVNGEDVYSLLQDFTLCPPSQELEIMVITPPLSQSLRRLVDTKGYPEITQPLDKTGRSVLFWVEGYIPTTAQIQSLITRDGRHRGMAWALLDGKDSIQQLDADRKRHDKAEEDEHEDANEPGNDDASETETEAQGKGQIRDYVRRTKIRWTIAFEDENEARRFVRRWHLRPFSEARERSDRGNDAPLVHAEFLW